MGGPESEQESLSLLPPVSVDPSNREKKRKKNPDLVDWRELTDRAAQRKQKLLTFSHFACDCDISESSIFPHLSSSFLSFLLILISFLHFFPYPVSSFHTKMDSKPELVGESCPLSPSLDIPSLCLCLRHQGLDLHMFDDIPFSGVSVHRQLHCSIHIS